MKERGLNKYYLYEMNAIVTGATKGIGRAIAKALAAEGFHLAIGARTGAEVEAFCKELARAYPSRKIIGFPVDFSDKEETLFFAEKVNAEFEKIDILVNNVGKYHASSVLNDEDGDMESMMAVNLYAAYYLCGKVVPGMIRQKSGHIFNICSAASVKPLWEAGPYTVSKFALYGLTKVLREELKPHHVKVTAILPGATLTSSWEGTDLPVARFIEPEDIAAALIAAWKTSPGALVEDIFINPILD